MPSRTDIIRKAPTFRNPGRNWSGLCEAAQFNLCDVFSPGPVRSFPDATTARKASKIEGPGLGPGGNFVWMSGVWSADRRTDYGHVAYHVGGGLLFMASSSVTDRIPGMTALGFIDGQAYLRRFSGQKLEGWSYDHGGTVLPGDGPIVVPAPAHGNSRPGTPDEGDEEMALTEDEFEERFRAVRTRAENATAEAKGAREAAERVERRDTNIENKLDVILRKLGIPDDQFPKPTQ